jgi:hypothetical protein
MGAGPIPNRTTICATLNAGATSAQINSAISSCPSGQVVFLSAGTYNLSGQVTLKSGVTLRGAGADQTHLIFTAGGSCGPINGGTTGAFICFPGPNADGTGGQNEAAVDCSAGCLSKGATTMTLGANTSGSTRPAVGTIVFLDQIVDGTTTASDRWPDVFTCQTANVCVEVGNGGAPQTARGSGATARSQSQLVTVTAVNGNSFTFTPAIMMPNWRASQSPHAWWVNASSFTNNAGLEYLWIDRSGSVSNMSSIAAGWTRNSWVMGIKSTNNYNNSSSSSLRTCTLWYSTNMTVRDSYFFDGADIGSQDAYAITVYAGGNMLFENNIIQYIRAPITMEQGSGIVASYNYVIRTVASSGSNAGWTYSGAFDNHGVSGDFDLIEGNDDVIINLENYHGNTTFATMFRNHMIGRDPAPGTNQTAPVMGYGYNRFWNAIGNVLGLTGYHNNYQYAAPSPSGNCNLSIYYIGGSGNCASGSFNDPHALASTYRWGNWDTVTNAVQWNSAEVPSGLTLYAQSVPTSQTLPASLYMAAKPAFFGSTPWPAIGPDVTGGDVAGAGGHAFRIPARKCFEDVMGGLYSDTAAKTFSAATCYGTTTGGPPVPTAPSNLRIIP